MISNALSIWYFFYPRYKHMRQAAIMLTAFLLGLYLFWLLNHGGKLKETPLSFFTLAAWSAWTCLLFLPAMHDRYGYLLDALRNARTEQVRMEISGPLSPVKVLPVEGNDFLYLVLPVRFKND